MSGVGKRVELIAAFNHEAVPLRETIRQATRFEQRISSIIDDHRRLICCDRGLQPSMKTTDYFEQTLLERPEIQRQWCQRVIVSPLKRVVQQNGRISYWAIVPEYGDRVLRVILLEDDATFHNAYFDRNFRSRLQRGLEP